MKYDSHNHTVKRLQLEMTGYYYTVAHRPGRMMEDANFLSRLNEETHCDPLIKDYMSFAREVYTDNKPPDGELQASNMPSRRSAKKKENIASTSLAILQYQDSDFEHPYHTFCRKKV